jgi:hypothetical protein
MGQTQDGSSSAAANSSSLAPSDPGFSTALATISDSIKVGFGLEEKISGTTLLVASPTSASTSASPGTSTYATTDVQVIGNRYSTAATPIIAGEIGSHYISF